MDIAPTIDYKWPDTIFTREYFVGTTMSEDDYDNLLGYSTWQKELTARDTVAIDIDYGKVVVRMSDRFSCAVYRDNPLYA